MTPEEQAAADAAAAAAVAADALAAANAAKDPYAGLPDEFNWMKDEITTVRSEAGGYRTQLRESQAKLEGAKTAEEYAEAVAAGATATAALEATLARERAVSKHKLPEAAAALLDGVSAEDMDARATVLASLAAGAPPATVTQAPLGGGTTPLTPAPPEPSGRELWRNRRK